MGARLPAWKPQDSKEARAGGGTRAGKNGALGTRAELTFDPPASGSSAPPPPAEPCTSTQAGLAAVSACGVA